ncbi:unnamed protein product [Acanthoscelides obtectus]|uniref:Uncharacterized protein n=1 Tax=Acanthoscelides obtectus TaxID=200917 RepID=A0A9P0NV36_ACAOB|nr:unnamed protein product [Acanthoscelides obtectus]CAK1666972.1 hypothetical protein AOBTE_LOCUS25586 [Acanthoscelides obtectus]
MCQSTYINHPIAKQSSVQSFLIAFHTYV